MNGFDTSFLQGCGWSYALCHTGPQVGSVQHPQALLQQKGVRIEFSLWVLCGLLVQPVFCKLHQHFHVGNVLTRYREEAFTETGSGEKNQCFKERPRSNGRETQSAVFPSPTCLRGRRCMLKKKTDLNLKAACGHNVLFLIYHPVLSHSLKKKT